MRAAARAAVFRNTFEKPISQSRDPKCTPAERQIGEARSKELARITAGFILRRTADVMHNFLPPKHEMVVFVRPSALQLRVYRSMLKSNTFVKLLSSSKQPTTCINPLACITALKKICNAPQLVFRMCGGGKEGGQGDGGDDDERLAADEGEWARALSEFPSGFDPKAVHVEHSGKLGVLRHILRSVMDNTKARQPAHALTTANRALTVLTYGGGDVMCAVVAGDGGWWAL